MSQSTKLTEILGSSELQTLLTQFNIMDANHEGMITLRQAKDYFQTIDLPEWDDRILHSTLIYSDQITFDEFLVLLYQVEKENNCEKTINKNHRLIEFLELLEDYRQKCEREEMYAEAHKSQKKSEEIMRKQIRRVEVSLNEQKRVRLEYVNTMEKQKLHEFHAAWSDYYEEFEESAKNVIENLKSRHLFEMERQEQRIKREMMRPRQTRAIMQMKEQQRLLARLKNYDKAQKIRDQCRRLQIKENRQHEQQIEKKILQKTQNLRKKQETLLMAQLKKIETSRDLHQKRQKEDADRLAFKLKRLKDEIQHEQTVQYKSNINKLRESMIGGIERKKKFQSVPRILNKNKKQTEYNPQSYDYMPQQKKKKIPFRIRVNSFNRPRFEQDTSIYDI